MGHARSHPRRFTLMNDDGIEERFLSVCSFFFHELETLATFKDTSEVRMYDNKV